MPTPDLLQQISGMIKRGRVKKTWNQTQLATHAGVSYTVVQGIEQGLRAPNVRTVMLLLRALELEPMLVLLDESGTPSFSPEQWETLQSIADAPVPEPDEPDESSNPGGLSTVEEDRIYAEEFRKIYPDPTHVAARTFLEEHPDMAEAIRRHQQLTLPQGAR